MTPLGRLVEQVTPESVRNPALRLNVGFTWEGLQALGLDATVLQSFPAEFREGMALRADILGDAGSSAPANWTGTFDLMSSIHVWLMIQAGTEAERGARVAEINTAVLADNACAIVGIEYGAQFGEQYRPAREHFGFNDNLSQPGVEGVGQPIRPGQGSWAGGNWKPIPVGCFVLGYANGYGETPQRPSDAILRTNSTYMVFRKLEQHVCEFRAYVADTAQQLGLEEELCAAKFVGRWRSGAPLALAPERDDPAIVDDPARVDDFRYSTGRRASAGCPVPHSAHIRRANPRDALGEDSVVDPANHRIIRRSAPYGPYLWPGSSDDGIKRGLLFRCFNASILDQFELVQGEWINGANESHGLSSDRDPLVGSREGLVSELDPDLSSSFTIPLADGSCPTRYGLPNFVTVRGGAYFFVPSLNALAALSAVVPAPSFAQQAAAALQATDDFTDHYSQISAAPGLDPADCTARQVELVLVTQGNQVALGNNLRRRDSTKIFATPMGVLLSTYADTHDVFMRDEVFSVCGYAQRMAPLTGPFMLGMDKGSEYERESTLMRMVAPSAELPQLRRWIEHTADVIVANLERGKPFDLVATIANRVPLAFINHYLGVPGSSDDLIMSWLRSIGLHIFEFWSPWIPSIEAAAIASAGSFNSYLDRLINDRRAAISGGLNVPDDILTRLLRLSTLSSPGAAGGALTLDHAGIRRNLAGFSVGSVVAASVSIVAAVSYLFAPGNETPRAVALSAAMSGDEVLLRKCMLESVRLGSPTPPSLFRTALSDYVLAKGTPRETLIPAGATVALYPAIAMTDPDFAADPGSFRTDRSLSTYVLFGEGMHTCFGTAIAEMFLVAVGRSLLKIGGLRQLTPVVPGTGVPAGFYPDTYMLFLPQ